jgi:hypothetical protein
MKKSERDKKNAPLDDDILQGREDVLRAKDIIPAAPSSAKEDSGILSLKLSQQSPDQTKIEKNDKEIPQLDLSENIMAGERKVSSAKRTAPVKEDMEREHTRPSSKAYFFNQSTMTTDEENRLLSQIVARDIKKLLQEK